MVIKERGRRELLYFWKDREILCQAYHSVDKQIGTGYL